MCTSLHIVVFVLSRCFFFFSRFFFFNDTATTEIYTLSLHDALPISTAAGLRQAHDLLPGHAGHQQLLADGQRGRSEEHTSELQSPCNLVCRLLLEKKKPPSPEPKMRVVALTEPPGFIIQADADTKSV